MIKISKFTSQLEAQMAAEALNGQGIRTEIVGAKDYTSHVLGSDAGSYNLLVDEENWANAEEILRSSQVALVPDEPLTPGPKSFLKKSILYAILAVVAFPLVTNYISLKNLFHYLQSEKVLTKKILFGIFVLLLQVPGILSCYFIIKSIPQ